MLHPITPEVIDLHRRLGDARLLCALRGYSVGQSMDALHSLCSKEPSAVARRLHDTITGGAQPVCLVTILDAEYPAAFRDLQAEVPPVLYVTGSADRLKARTFAIIGTRRPNRAGRETARAVAVKLAASGWCVVSGNAPGIDAYAHEAALRGGGDTLVFPAASIDKYQPAFRMNDPQAVTAVSAFVPGASVEPWMFLRRNTYVAAHCRAALVAETATRGGTLDTVKKLQRMGKSTFATALGEGEKNHKAHGMLQAGGVLPFAWQEGDEIDISCMLAAAEACPAHSPTPIAVLDDLFSAESFSYE